jgi:arylsulfatase A-like enzyme
MTPEDTMRHRRTIGRLAVLALATCCLSHGLIHSADAAGKNDGGDEKGRKPNFVIVFTDDQGYGDVGCFGAVGFETPNLDRMAGEGRKFTSFYVAQAVCSASRTALLTGCYPNRVGILGALGPQATHGIHADEMTIAEVLKPQGYAAACYGKWHLGHREPFLPTSNGFDDYFGLPYSNDMWPFHPTNKSFPDLPMYAGTKVVDPQVTPEEQTRLTTQYTEHAVRFIDEHADGPFFLYVAHSMPHVPLFVSEKFAGKSQRGVFGDVISEIDWSVGEILGALKRNGVDEHTLVVFTCDNGPWLSYGTHAGSAGPLREGKGTSWEGGVREPCIMRWPGKIPAGTECDEIAATIDILPTFAHLAGAEPPQHKIDGRNIWPLMSGAKENGQDAASPHEAYFYYWGRELQCVRSGPWKLHFPHEYRSLKGEGGTGGRPIDYVQKKTDLALYNLESDIGETRNVAAENPEVVARLRQHAERIRADLGDSRTRQEGNGVRPAGQWKAK